MSVSKLLLWEKWRPKTLEDIILLPRVRNNFNDGVNQNYIFYGHYGTGKTSLARILIGKYSKDKPFLELNSSLFTSIDVLRNQIEDFCKFSPMLDSADGIKYIFLDEFERVSPQFQDAFKAFIEKYNKNVRFIITTNHINKISDGIKSRIPQINFDYINVDEEKFLKQEMYKRIVNVILPSENQTIPKDNLVSIITKKFPDFRSIIVELQNFIDTGGQQTETTNVSTKSKLELYNLISKKGLDYDECYHFLMNNFGPDKIDTVIKLLGKQFVDWYLEQKFSDINNLFECNYVISDYGPKLPESTDPIILGMTIVGKINKIIT
jgi:DNA polymerase III delta prime subunit